MPIRRVAVLIQDRVAPFDLGVLCEVFGTDRTDDGFPAYEFTVCSQDGEPVRSGSGFMITPQANLDPLEDADLIAVPAHSIDSAVAPPVAAALRRAHERGAYVLSVCSGAFMLGEAGLLDGRECTTHWRHSAELARRFPTAKVHDNELYVEDDRILTSAGTAGGIDLCLYLVRRVHGSAVATRLARRMVVPPHRDGGQAQFVEAPLPRTAQAPTLEPLLAWLVAHLDQSFTVEDLAARVHMTPRTFARHFRAEVGSTPHNWLTAQRVLHARRLLEETDLSVDAIATRAGFGEAAALRHHFARRVGSTPQRYRATFASIKDERHPNPGKTTSMRPWSTH